MDGVPNCGTGVSPASVQPRRPHHNYRTSRHPPGADHCRRKNEPVEKLTCGRLPAVLRARGRTLWEVPVNGQASTPRWPAFDGAGRKCRGTVLPPPVKKHGPAAGTADYFIVGPRSEIRQQEFRLSFADREQICQKIERVLAKALHSPATRCNLRLAHLYCCQHFFRISTFFASRA
jgi:hypothetical protein